MISKNKMEKISLIILLAITLAASAQATSYAGMRDPTDSTHYSDNRISENTTLSLTNTYSFNISSGVPNSFAMVGEPVITDTDDNGQNEFWYVSAGTIYVTDNNFVSIALNSTIPSLGTLLIPTATDLDQNGISEVAVGNGTDVFFFKLNGSNIALQYSFKIGLPNGFTRSIEDLQQNTTSGKISLYILSATSILPTSNYSVLKYEASSGAMVLTKNFTVSASVDAFATSITSITKWSTTDMNGDGQLDIGFTRNTNSGANDHHIYFYAINTNGAGSIANFDIASDSATSSTTVTNKGITPIGYSTSRPDSWMIKASRDFRNDMTLNIINQNSFTSTAATAGKFGVHGGQGIYRNIGNGMVDMMSVEAGTLLFEYSTVRAASINYSQVQADLTIGSQFGTCSYFNNKNDLIFAICPLNETVVYKKLTSGNSTHFSTINGITNAVNGRLMIMDITGDGTDDILYVGTDNSITVYTAGSTVTATPNQTAYRVTAYFNNNTNNTQIRGVTRESTTTTYAVGKHNGQLSVISYDHLNPNNIIADNYTLQNTKTPRGISTLGDTLIIGSNSNAFLFNNTGQEDVTQIQQQEELQDGAFTDDIVAIKYATAEIAYACDSKGFGTLIKYNTTSGTVMLTKSFESCTDLAVDSGGDNIYAYYGTSGVKIFNTNLTQIGSINEVTSTPESNPTDVLSVYANHLSVVTGRNVIKTYSITTPSTPTLEWECRASLDITAIEALDDQVIAIGTAYSLQLCNQNDTGLYDSANAYYVSKQLRVNTNGGIQLDMEANQNLQVRAAEGTQFALYSITIGDLANFNLPPIINSVTLTPTNPCINQTVYGNLEATDPDTPEQLTKYYACDGSTYSFTVSGSFTCSYTTSGTKTLRFKATDAASTTTSTQAISVQSCVIGNTTNPINLQVYDGINTTMGLPDVLLQIEGDGSTTTDATGFAYMTLPNAGTYNATISKSGYITQVGTITTGNQRTIAYLEPIENSNGESRTILTIHVRDENNNAVANALVSITNDITGQSKFGNTNALGDLILADIFTGTHLRITATKEGYGTTKIINAVGNNVTELSSNLYVDLTEGEQKTVNLQLKKNTAIIGNSRGCQDFIDGVMLCSPRNINGTGDNCIQDTDCLSSRCQKITPTSTHGTCSEFNWTLCDSQGRERNSRCFTANYAQGAFAGIASTVLTYFLYVIIGLAILVIFLMVMASINKK